MVIKFTKSIKLATVLFITLLSCNNGDETETIYTDISGFWVFNNDEVSGQFRLGESDRPDYFYEIGPPNTYAVIDGVRYDSEITILYRENDLSGTFNFSIREFKVFGEGDNYCEEYNGTISFEEVTLTKEFTEMNAKRITYRVCNGIDCNENPLCQPLVIINDMLITRP